jgi:hypothetical protein
MFSFRQTTVLGVIVVLVAFGCESATVTETLNEDGSTTVQVEPATSPLVEALALPSVKAEVNIPAPTEGEDQDSSLTNILVAAGTIAGALVLNRTRSIPWLTLIKKAF